MATTRTEFLMIFTVTCSVINMGFLLEAVQSCDEDMIQCAPFISNGTEYKTYPHETEGGNCVCCQRIMCPRGERYWACNKHDPSSGYCQKCGRGLLAGTSTISTEGYRCSRKQKCRDERSMLITKDGGSFEEDECVCDTSKNFYNPNFDVNNPDKSPEECARSKRQCSVGYYLHQSGDCILNGTINPSPVTHGISAIGGSTTHPTVISKKPGVEDPVKGSTSTTSRAEYLPPKAVRESSTTPSSAALMPRREDPHLPSHTGTLLWVMIGLVVLVLIVIVALLGYFIKNRSQGTTISSAVCCGDVSMTFSNDGPVQIGNHNRIQTEEGTPSIATSIATTNSSDDYYFEDEKMLTS